MPSQIMAQSGFPSNLRRLFLARWVKENVFGELLLCPWKDSVLFSGERCRQVCLLPIKVNSLCCLLIGAFPFLLFPAERLAVCFHAVQIVLRSAQLLFGWCGAFHCSCAYRRFCWVNSRTCFFSSSFSCCKMRQRSSRERVSFWFFLECCDLGIRVEQDVPERKGAAQKHLAQFLLAFSCKVLHLLFILPVGKPLCRAAVAENEEVSVSE